MTLKEAAQTFCDAWRNNESPISNHIDNLEAALGSEPTSETIRIMRCEHLSTTANGAQIYNDAYDAYICCSCNLAYCVCTNCDEKEDNRNCLICGQRWTG